MNFEEDIYSLTFIKMINSDQSNLTNELMLKCYITFTTQITLTVIILIESGGGA